MKSLFCFFIFSITLDALAMPYRCSTQEKISGVPAAILKISPPYTLKDEPANVLGVTLSNGTRLVILASGVLDERGGSFNFAEYDSSGFSLGYLRLKDKGQLDTLSGTFKHRSVNNGVETHIVCRNIEKGE